MTEREMLELAAKAARIKLLIWQEGGMQPGFLLQDDRRLWNPLADDGDALRLSSMLRLSIRSHRDGSVSVSWYDKGGFFAGNVVEEYGSLRNGDHPTAHVRRAITRAAAEIGKQMGGGDV